LTSFSEEYIFIVRNRKKFRIRNPKPTARNCRSLNFILKSPRNIVLAVMSVCHTSVSCHLLYILADNTNVHSYAIVQCCVRLLSSG